MALSAAVLTAPQASASYPGADGKIAFVRSNQIYKIKPSGTRLVKLTSGAKNYRPEWSPNGRRIAYIHETSTGSKDVWVMRANGTRKRQVTKIGNVTAAATWSPDGKWLAFAGGPLSTLQRVRASSPFGSPDTLGGRILDNGLCGEQDVTAFYVDRYLAWSPDGTTIAFQSFGDCKWDQDMYMYNIETGDASQYRKGGGDTAFQWKDIAWGPAGQFGYGEIKVIDGIPQPSYIIYPGFVSQAGDTSPAPSPGNSRMAFTNASSGTARIYVAKINGSNRRMLTAGYQADWQPKQ